MFFGVIDPSCIGQPVQEREKAWLIGSGAVWNGHSEAKGQSAQSGDKGNEESLTDHPSLCFIAKARRSLVIG